MAVVLLSHIPAISFVTKTIEITELSTEEFLHLLPRVNLNLCKLRSTDEIIRREYPALPPVRDQIVTVGRSNLFLIARLKKSSYGKQVMHITLNDYEFCQFSVF